MKIRTISIENYKAFAKKQTIQLKPITILIGKNSSGKSSIAKLFTLLENSLSGEINEPLLVKNNGVELGAEFRDLVFDRATSTPISFDIEFEDNSKLGVKIIQDNLNYELDILEWSLDDFVINYKREKGFTDFKGNKYQTKFKGFIPTEIINPDFKSIVFANHSLILKLLNQVKTLKIDVDYIGPFRILPERQFYLSGQIEFKNTGIKGENAYAMLGVSKRLKTNLLEKVGEWYEKNFDGWKLNIKDNNPFMEVFLSKNTTDVNIVDVGQGMNQALPLVVRAYEKRENSIIVMEQPELHLHPAAHAELAELFARSAKENNQTFVIETHSENILLRLRKLIIENNFGFTKDDFIIYWIEDAENGGQELREITVDEKGVLSDWSEGVFNENVKEILEMQKALRKKNHN